MDNVFGSMLKWSQETDNDQHYNFNGENADRLRKALTLKGGHEDISEQVVEDVGREKPPSILLEVIVKEGVLDPHLFILKQSCCAAVNFDLLACCDIDASDEENEEAGKDGNGYCCK